MISIRELLLALKEASDGRRWSILDAVLNIGDPFLLSSPKDPLWIGHSLQNGAVYYWLYIEKRIEKGMDDLKKEAQRLDQPH